MSEEENGLCRVAALGFDVGSSEKAGVWAHMQVGGYDLEVAHTWSDVRIDSRTTAFPLMGYGQQFIYLATNSVLQLNSLIDLHTRCLQTAKLIVRQRLSRPMVMACMLIGRNNMSL